MPAKVVVCVCCTQQLFILVKPLCQNRPPKLNQTFEFRYFSNQTKPKNNGLVRFDWFISIFWFVTCAKCIPINILIFTCTYLSSVRSDSFRVGWVEN